MKIVSTTIEWRKKKEFNSPTVNPHRWHLLCGLDILFPDQLKNNDIQILFLK